MQCKIFHNKKQLTLESVPSAHHAAYRSYENITRIMLTIALVLVRGAVDACEAPAPVASRSPPPPPPPPPGGAVTSVPVP